MRSCRTLVARLNIPFAIPFEARVNIFQSFIVIDKHNIGTDICSFDQFHSRTLATMRRSLVAEDGLDKLGEANLKRLIQITFIDQFRGEPSGLFFCGVLLIGGGCTGWVLTVGTSSKEYLTDLPKEVFDSDRGHWPANKKNELYPSHGSYATEHKQQPRRASIILSVFIFLRSP